MKTDKSVLATVADVAMIVAVGTSVASLALVGNALISVQSLCIYAFGSDQAKRRRRAETQHYRDGLFTLE